MKYYTIHFPQTEKIITPFPGNKRERACRQKGSYFRINRCRAGCADFRLVAVPVLDIATLHGLHKPSAVAFPVSFGYRMPDPASRDTIPQSQTVLKL